MGMKNTIILVGLMSISVHAFEQDFKALIQRNNHKNLAFMMIVASVGIHKLITEANEYCQANAPFCWKVAAPLLPAALLTGSLLYKKMKSTKRVI